MSWSIDIPQLITPSVVLVISVVALVAASSETMSNVFWNNPFQSSNAIKSTMMRAISLRSDPGPISPKDGIHQVPLLKKTTLVEGIDGKVCPVRTFTFGIPKNDVDDSLASTFDLGVGDILKTHIRNPTTSMMTHKSYSPTKVSQKGSFDVTVKIYPNGVNSQVLDSLAVGDSIGVSGPWPPKVMRKQRRVGQQVNIVAYGVGMTEAYHVAKAELQRKGSTSQVKLLYANRHEEDAFFQKELQQLKDKFRDRFELTYIYSRDDHVPKGALQGRIDSGVLNQVFELVGDSPANTKPEQQRFLIVGSKPMMWQTWKYLGELGFNSKEHAFLVKT